MDSQSLSFQYGVAGSSPLADYPSKINVMLCDAIKNRWDLDVDAGTPPASDILFLNTWFTGTKDVEMIFRQGFDDKPVQLKSIDLRWEGHITTVDIHTFIRSYGGDIEPPEIGKVIRGIDKIIAMRRNSLIPHATCRLESEQPAPAERPDDLQTLWHNLIRIRCQYFKVMV